MPGNDGKPVLVTYATGRQGGAVLRHLLGLGQPVRPRGLRVQDFWSSGAARQVRQGINVADAAAATGVAHLVWTSAGGTEPNSAIVHRDTKWQMEQHIRAVGLPATKPRPAASMKNCYNPAGKKALLKGRHRGDG